MVFDLDACCWYPEMYMLWGGGSPFKYDSKSGNCIDKTGTKVYLLGIVRSLFKDLHTQKHWKNTKVATGILFNSIY